MRKERQIVPSQQKSPLSGIHHQVHANRNDFVRSTQITNPPVKKEKQLSYVICFLFFPKEDVPTLRRCSWDGMI
jgi:hypothetical protein